MRLFRLIIYVEIKENLTYIASTTTTTKKSQDTRTTGAIVSRGHKYFADTHKKKHNEKLVLICQPSLYPQPPGPRLEALDFSRRLPWGRKVEDEKEQGF